MLRGYDPKAQQVWQVAKVVAAEENRALSPADLWWGCLAVLPEEKWGELGLKLPSGKKKWLQKVREQRVEKRISVAPAVTRLDQNLKQTCRSTGIPAATVWHMLLALLEQPDPELNTLLGELQADREALRQLVQQQAEENKPASRQVPLPAEARQVLRRFTRNLTEAAAQGELGPAYERDAERKAIVRTLLRKGKRNVALVGPAGVGKTKMVEDLALRIFQGEIPQLADCEVVVLSPTALRAGTSAHGDLEQRFEQLRNVLEDYGDRLILFIDELHVIVGTAVSSATLDLANALKPLLASGRIRCIGATTQQEFIQYIERDRALARRFQMVPLAEPSRQAMEAILQAVAPEYEAHHGVRYPLETLQAILDLADVYLPNRYYPDKALDILDEAGAWVVLQQGPERPEEPTVVTPEVVRLVLSEMLQVPLEDLDAEALPHLAERLGERVLGQGPALQQVQDVLIGSSARQALSQRPRASLVFVGPPGCGKTFTAQVLAETLCHSRTALLDLDLDQVVRTYWHGSGADFLLGPRPPYVGWEHGGVLTNHVLEYPQSVILVRGLQRAQPDVQHLFAGIMERGEVEDGRGQRVSFRGVILILHLEGQAGEGRPIGFLASAAPEVASADPVRRREELLQSGLLPDLVRELDRVIPFQPLSRDALREIARRRLEAFRRELYEREGKALDIPEGILAHLIGPETYTAAAAEDRVEQLVILPVNALRSSPHWAQWQTIALSWEEGVSVEPVRPRLLVVDDLPDFYRELAASYPEYHWLYAENAEAAGRLLEQERPHLVLIDTCFNPADAADAGGLEVLKTLRERFPDQPIVPVTAQGLDFQTTREAFRLGAYDYLWKPPEESVLRKLVEALVAREEAQRRLAVQEKLLRERWQREVEEDEAGVRITYRH